MLSHSNSTTDLSGQFDSTPKPPFPTPGSVIGRDGRYFCLGPLGRGTFCSIYKCVDLSNSHTLIPSEENGSNKIVKKMRTNARPKLHIVAAKVELSTFSNSGVLDSEAAILSYLSDCFDDSVPIFVEYIKSPTIVSTPSTISKITSSSSKESSISGGMSAIIMEYIPGEDMHTLRDQHCSASPLIPISPSPVQDPLIQTPVVQPIHPTFRRLSVSDAVYLCADVMLPLIRKVHNMGIIHRDIKPSNCVRAFSSGVSSTFRLIDFGLSKSFIVPKDSALADDTKPWHRDTWMMPFSLQNKIQQQQESQNSHRSSTDVHEPIKGYFRKERVDADFRGTSMYASLRVHQLRDFSRRDDLWSLMYVFCDFVSGGLPWMTFAAARDRKMCQVIKEWVHGERSSLADDPSKDETHADDTNEDINPNHEDHVDELLKGAEYHIKKFKREKSTTQLNDEGTSNTMNTTSTLSIEESSLPMSRDLDKVNCLRTIFQHLAVLDFSDEPDYDLVHENLTRFGKSISDHDLLVPSIQWDQATPVGHSVNLMSRDGDTTDAESLARVNKTVTMDEVDPLEEVIRNDAQKELLSSYVLDSDNGKNSKLPTEVEDLMRLPLTLQLRLAQVEYNACNPSTIPINVALRHWLAFACSLLNDPWDISKYERREYCSIDISYRREVYARLLRQCLDAVKPFKAFTSVDSFFYPADAINMKYENRKKRKNSDHAKLLGCDGKGLLPLFSKVYRCIAHTLEAENQKNIAPPFAPSF